MSFRTVVIESRCKLDLKMGYLVVREGECTKRIFLDEIALLILENTAISMTGCLLAELTAKKIRVIFCDEKRNPTAELSPLYGCHDCSQKIKLQMKWSDDIKGAVWADIIAEKIRRQSALLAFCGHNEKSQLLKGYIKEIAFNDATNREGHAAKVYFNTLFGMDFTRSDSENVINAALNYGYSIILSAINREVCANGYLTQLGIFHCNMFNQFNLSCDLIEPFRIYVDKFVVTQKYNLFETKEKHEMLVILQETVLIDSAHQVLLNAIKIYVRSVFDALNDGDLSLIKFPSYEL